MSGDDWNVEADLESVGYYDGTDGDVGVGADPFDEGVVDFFYVVKFEDAEED